jgi:ADP-ribosylation factor-like protein 1
MGGFFSKVWTKLFKSAKELKLMMIGLDFAGKTTILIRMQTGEKASSTRPTIGFNLEQINFKNFKLKVWDLSGQEKVFTFESWNVL